MRFKRIAMSILFAAGVAALPFSRAEAQYYYPCNPFPLFWPFCAAAAVVTAPFRAIAAAPYYYPYGPYYGPYYYGSPAPGYAGSYGYATPPYPGPRPSGH
jgi:hypothetical protein